MVQISAVALFLIGVSVGIVIGVVGMIIVALNYKEGNSKDGKNKKE